MVHRFFITFLHNSCNFQYLILGWSTLVLSPSDGLDYNMACTLLYLASDLDLEQDAICLDERSVLYPLEVVKLGKAKNKG